MANQQKFLQDALGAFPLGINSGLDAFIVPPNQLSFAVNSTVRGNFVTNRPPFVICPLSASDDINGVLSGKLFQGGCYYRPDTGQEQIVAQIGGRLFTFTPTDDGSDFPVSEVTVAGDPNPENAPQAWLRQSEKWVVVNNGLSIPVFYDGVSSRRSRPVSVVQGTSDLASAPFTPPINGSMQLKMTVNYVGVVGEAVQLVEYDNNGVVTSTTTWVVLAVGVTFNTNNVTLKNLSDTAGAVQGAASALVIQPSNLGSLVARTVTSTLVGTTYTNIKLTATLSAALPSYVVVGNKVSINSFSNWTITSIAANRKDIICHQPDSTAYPGNIPGTPVTLGAEVYLVGYAAPNVSVGILSANFTAPAVGATVTTTLNEAYTGALNQIIFVNGKQYQITAFSTTPAGGTDTITLQNLNDTRLGHQWNTGTSTPAQIFNFPELPPGRMGAYGMGRNWQSLIDGISFLAGDITGGSSGSPAYRYRDAVLKVSENSFLAGGGVFAVPSNAGLITAMQFTAQLDESLGQGNLMVVTPGGVFSCNTPVDRTTWQSLTNPILTQSLIGLGGLGQNGTININGDLIFRAVDGIRSLIMARRQFTSWGNTPISFEMKRVLDKDNVAGLPAVSAVQFDNRMLMTCSPVQGAQGIYNQGMAALNFDPISSINGKSASVYDGLWTGINVLQIIEGQFSGVHRCFAFTFSTTDGIQLYEIKKDGYLDNGTQPIQWSFETPVLFRSAEGKGFFDFTSLEDGEIYVDDIQPGHKVSFKVEYRPDFAKCWFPWREFSVCNDSESLTPLYGSRLGLGKPESQSCNEANESSSSSGRWFQLRISIVGHCVFKGVRIKASTQPESEYAKVVCDE